MSWISSTFHRPEGASEEFFSYFSMAVINFLNSSFFPPAYVADFQPFLLGSPPAQLVHLSRTFQHADNADIHSTKVGLGCSQKPFHRVGEAAADGGENFARRFELFHIVAGKC